MQDNSFVGECFKIFDELIWDGLPLHEADHLEDSAWIDSENRPHLAAIFADNGSEYGPMTVRFGSISASFRKAMNIKYS